jgi:nucleoside-diphosphate-sugar epimerase
MNYFSNRKVCVSGLDGRVGKLFSTLIKNENLLKLDLQKNIQADMLIHLVVSSQNERIIESNIVYLNEVITYAQRNNIKNLVFFSTMSIYGKQNQFDVSEDTLPNDPSLYGLSKLFAEKLLKDSGLNVLIVRLPAIMTLNSDAFLSLIFEKIENNQDVSLENYDKAFNGLITVEDIVKFIESYKFHKEYEIVNLALEHNQSLHDIVTYYKEIAKSSSQISFVDNVNGFYNISIEKAKNEYSFQPFTYKEALQKIYKIRVLDEK